MARIRRLRLIAFVGALLAVVGLYMVDASFSQAPGFSLTDLLLQKDDLPAPSGLEWEQTKVQGPEELAEEIAKFTGLSLERSGFLEGRAVGFFSDPDSDPKVISIVQGIYRYASEEVAVDRYEQLLVGLPLALRRGEMLITNQVEWSFKGTQGQVIEALDLIEVADAYWFVGVQRDLVTILQVWSCHPFGPGPDSSDKAVLTELLPRALEKMARSR